MTRLPDKIDINKITKGGDANGESLIIGTTDAQDLYLIREGVTGFEMGATATTISGVKVVINSQTSSLDLLAGAEVKLFTSLGAKATLQNDGTLISDVPSYETKVLAGGDQVFANKKYVDDEIIAATPALNDLTDVTAISTNDYQFLKANNGGGAGDKYITNRVRLEPLTFQATPDIGTVYTDSLTKTNVTYDGADYYYPLTTKAPLPVGDYPTLIDAIAPVSWLKYFDNTFNIGTVIWPETFSGLQPLAQGDVPDYTTGTFWIKPEGSPLQYMSKAGTGNYIQYPINDSTTPKSHTFIFAGCLSVNNGGNTNDPEKIISLYDGATRKFTFMQTSTSSNLESLSFLDGDGLEQYYPLPFSDFWGQTPNSNSVTFSAIAEVDNVLDKVSIQFYGSELDLVGGPYIFTMESAGVTGITLDRIQFGEEASKVSTWGMMEMVHFNKLLTPLEVQDCITALRENLLVTPSPIGYNIETMQILSPASGEVVKYNGDKFVNDNVDLGELGDVDLITNPPVSIAGAGGSALVFTGTDWVPSILLYGQPGVSGGILTDGANINLNTGVTGDIILSSTEINLNTTSGNINLNTGVTGDINLNTGVTGDIILSSTEINLNTTGGNINLGVAGETGSIAVISVANKTAETYATEIVGIPSAIPNVEYIDNALVNTTLGALLNVNSVADTGPTGGDGLVWSGTEWLPGNPKLREGEESVVVTALGITGSIQNIGIITGGLTNDSEILVRVGDPPGTLKHVHLHPLSSQVASCVPISYGDNAGLTGATNPYAWYRAEDLNSGTVGSNIIWTPNKDISSWDWSPVNFDISGNGISSIKPGTSQVSVLHPGSFIGGMRVEEGLNNNFVVQLSESPLSGSYTIFVAISQWNSQENDRRIISLFGTDNGIDWNTSTNISILNNGFPHGVNLDSTYNPGTGVVTQPHTGPPLNNLNNVVNVFVFRSNGTDRITTTYFEGATGEVETQNRTDINTNLNPKYIGLGTSYRNVNSNALNAAEFNVGDIVVYQEELGATGRASVANTIIEHYANGPCLEGGITYPLDTKLGDLSNVNGDVDTFATDGEVLTYNSTSSKWENSPIQLQVNDLTDVVITGGVTGQQLEYDGSGWRNRDTISLFDVGATAGAVADITADTPPGSTGQLSTRVKVYLNGTEYYMYLDPV